MTYLTDLKTAIENIPPNTLDVILFTLTTLIGIAVGWISKTFSIKISTKNNFNNNAIKQEQKNEDVGIVQQAQQINNYGVSNKEDVLNNPPNLETTKTKQKENHEHIIEMVSLHLDKLSLPEDFKEKYKDAINNLKSGNETICASQIFGTFRETIEILKQNSDIYHTTPSREIINSVDKSFSNIKKFLDKENSDLNLTILIDTFENSLIKVLSNI